MKDDEKRQLEWAQLAAEYSWDMTGYIQKCSFGISDRGMTLREAKNAFQLVPAPPEVEDINDHIITAQRERELRYFSFFLHCYEDKLNKRIECFLINEGCGYDPERFLDYKMNCVIVMLERLRTYDSTKSKFKTFIHWSVRDAMLLQRIIEGAGSYPSLAYYKCTRKLAWKHHNLGKTRQEAAEAFVEDVRKAGGKTCSVKAASKYLDVAIMSRNQKPFYLLNRDEDDDASGEDNTRDDSWDYAEIIDDGIPAKALQAAFDKLDYREQTLVEKRNAICMTCGRVSSLRSRQSFEDLAVMFEGSGASGAERAYRKALDKLTRKLVESGTLHSVELRRVSQTKAGKKISAAVYEYLADNDGAWGKFDSTSLRGQRKLKR